MTPEQLLVAIHNTVAQPRNHAPVLFQALKNDKPAEAGLHSPVAGHHNKGGCCEHCKV